MEESQIAKTHLYSGWDEGVVREIMGYSKKQKNGTWTENRKIKTILPDIASV